MLRQFTRAQTRLGAALAFVSVHIVDNAVHAVDCGMIPVLDSDWCGTRYFRSVRSSKKWVRDLRLGIMIVYRSGIMKKDKRPSLSGLFHETGQRDT